MKSRLVKDVLIPAVFYSFLILVCQTVVVIGFEVFYVARLAGTGLNAALAEAADALLKNESIILIIGDFAALAVIFIVSRVKKVSFFGYVGLRKSVPLKTVLISVSVGFWLYIWVSFMLSALPIPDEWLESYASYSEVLETDSAVAFISTVIAAPLTEEIVFRGLVYKYFRICMPEYGALFIQAIIFAAYHGPTFLWMAYAFVCALVLGYVVMLTGSVRTSIALHTVFNLCGYLLEKVENETVFTVLAFMSPVLLIFSVYGLYRQTSK